MTQFKSSIGRRNSAPAQPQRNYTIPDGASLPSEFIDKPTQEMYNQSFFATQAQNMSQDPFPPQATNEDLFPGQPSFSNPYQQPVQQQQTYQPIQQQNVKQTVNSIQRKLDALLHSTILKKEIEIDDVLRFTIKNLSNEEQMRAILAATEAKFKIEESSIIRDYMVAQSIDNVSNMTIEQIFGKDTIEFRLYLVKKIDDKIVVRLHQEVLLFQEECEKKYGVKTEAEFNRLVDEIKKA